MDTIDLTNIRVEPDELVARAGGVEADAAPAAARNRAQQTGVR